MKTTFLSAGLLGLCAALAWSAATKSPAPAAPGDLNLTAQLADIGGAPFTGSVTIQLSQIDFGASDATSFVLGPFASTCTNGVVSSVVSSNDLALFDLNEEVVFTFWRVGDFGLTGADRAFFLDSSEAIRAQSPALLTGPMANGEYGAILPGLKFAEAPQYGSVLVSSSQGASLGLTAYLIPTFPISDGSFGREELIACGAIEQLAMPYDVATPIFSWTTDDAGYYVTSLDGWGSADDILPRGSSVTNVVLMPEGSVKAQFNLATYPDASNVVLFDAASFAPFTPTTSHPGAIRGQAELRAEYPLPGSLLGHTDNGDQATRVFDRIPAGSYVLEFWTYSGIGATPPAPTYQTTITVTGGAPLVINIP